MSMMLVRGCLGCGGSLVLMGGWVVDEAQPWEMFGGEMVVLRL